MSWKKFYKKWKEDYKKIYGNHPDGYERDCVRSANGIPPIILDEYTSDEVKMRLYNLPPWPEVGNIVHYESIVRTNYMSDFSREENMHFIDVPGWYVQGKYVGDSMNKNSLDCCKTSAPIPVIGPVETETDPCWSTFPKKKEKTMNYDINNDISIAAPADPSKQAKDRLSSRLYALNYAKDTELQRKFGLRADEAPSTANEIVARIKDGKFVIPEGKGDSNAYEPMRFIEWRDPSVKKDVPGYKAAEKILSKQYNDTLDEILVKEPIDGLAALRAFESATVN